MNKLDFCLDEPIQLKYSTVHWSSWMNPIKSVQILQYLIKDSKTKNKKYLKQVRNTTISLLNSKSWYLLLQKCPELSIELLKKISTTAWSRDIKERDTCCQVCDSKENLQSHHIFYRSKYPLLKFNLNNGILLCTQHHAEIHMQEQGVQLIENF